MILYNMLVVDDEPIILKGLIETYDWQAMGFNIIGSAKNGSEAFELICEQQPDVVLTDILMKKMDGLELISRCQDQYPELYFVVISAYREFELAQKACSLGVFSFLLKPLEETQIKKVMSDLYINIKQEKARKEQLYSYQRIIEEHQHTFETRSLRRFLVHQEDINVFEKSLNLVKSSLISDGQYLVICVDINMSDRIIGQIDTNSQRFALSELLSKKINLRYPNWYFEMSDGRLIMILLVKDCLMDEAYLRCCLNHVEVALKIHTTAAIAPAERGFEGLRVAFIKAIRLFEMGSESGVSIVSSDSLSRIHPTGDTYPSTVEHEIIHAIRINDETKSIQYLDFFRQVVMKDNGTGMPQLYYHRLALAIFFFLKQTYGLTQKIEIMMCSYLREIQGMSFCDASEVLSQAIRRIIRTRCDCSAQFLDSQSDRYIADSQLFIDQNLDMETLSICDVSSHLHLNASYFGRFFKSKTGTTFKEYLQKKRIAKAMQLMDTTDKSIIEVAQEVGIRNPSYFTLLFKQSTGILPSSYKRKTST